MLNSEEFVDEAPATVYAKLLDEGVYLASVPTMYRVLRDHDEVRERRRQATHPAAKKPELLATKPNQVWSWDITKLLGPAKWTYYYLYVIIDIYSRYVPGWMLAHAENADARRGAAGRHRRQAEHRPRPAHHPRRPRLVDDLQAGRVPARRPRASPRRHSRPHVSNDNPFSESQFRTLKYRPDFPDRFGCFEDARAFCGRLLRLVQRRAPPLRHRVPHPRRRPLRASRARPRSSAPTSSTPPTPSTPNASSASHPNRRRCPPPCGSTSRRRTPLRHSDSRRNLPQKG